MIRTVKVSKDKNTQKNKIYPDIWIPLRNSEFRQRKTCLYVNTSVIMFSLGSGIWSVHCRGYGSELQSPFYWPEPKRCSQWKTVIRFRYSTLQSIYFFIIFLHLTALSTLFKSLTLLNEPGWALQMTPWCIHTSVKHCTKKKLWGSPTYYQWVTGKWSDVDTLATVNS